MIEGLIVGIIVVGINVVKVIYWMVGVINFVEVVWGIIWGDFGCEWLDGNLCNVVYIFDNLVNVKWEIEIWFLEWIVVD